MCKGIIRVIRIVWLETDKYRRKGLLLFPMTSNRRNFPRLILLDSISMGRNRENGFGNSGGSRCWRRERNLTSTALLEFQRRPKRDSRFFSSTLVKISTACHDQRIETSHDSSRSSIDRKEFGGRIARMYFSEKLDSIGKLILRNRINSFVTNFWIILLKSAT